MIIALTLLALFAIVAAIGAASRVQTQITSQSSLAASPAQRFSPLSATSLQETESPEARKPQVDGDREFEPSQSASLSKTPSQPTESAVSQQSAATASIPPELSPSELLQSSVTPEIPLAASLTVTELVHPPEVEPALQLADAETQAPPSLEDALEQHPAHHNLLQEIAQLDDSSHHNRISHLARYIDHSDSVMRAAAAFALGELGATTQGQELEEMVAMLNQFTEDANPQVRLQAVTALEKVQRR